MNKTTKKMIELLIFFLLNFVNAINLDCSNYIYCPRNEKLQNPEEINDEGFQPVCECEDADATTCGKVTPFEYTFIDYSVGITCFAIMLHIIIYWRSTLA